MFETLEYLWITYVLLPLSLRKARRLASCQLFADKRAKRRFARALAGLDMDTQLFALEMIENGKTKELCRYFKNKLRLLE